MMIFLSILFLFIQNICADETPLEYQPFLPLIANRMPIDSVALQEYAQYHNTPFFYALPMVQTQGTAIHLSSYGLWITAAHVVAGAQDIFVIDEQDKQEDIDVQKIPVSIVGMDVQKDIAFLSISPNEKNTPFYPTVFLFDMKNKIDETEIKATGFSAGIRTSFSVQQVYQEDDIWMWKGKVEPGMSGGPLWQPSSNELLGMILSYEPSKNMSRALSAQWIQEHFESIVLQKSKSKQIEQKHSVKESDCVFHNIYFQQQTSGIKVVGLDANAFNLGLQVGDFLQRSKEQSIDCSFFPVSQTTIIEIIRQGKLFYWIAHPEMTK